MSVKMNIYWCSQAVIFYKVRRINFYGTKLNHLKFWLSKILCRRITFKLHVLKPVTIVHVKSFLNNTTKTIHSNILFLTEFDN